MRVVPPTIRDAWYGGDFSGPRRNMARVTVQHAGMKLYQLPYNLYASYVFGSDAVPMELPNVASVKWGRSRDQDFATATFVFYNTEPMPLGERPTRDLDNPGFFTYNRGVTQFSDRWGLLPNKWQNMLMPDNVLRSYEGYGFDASVAAEVDPHLVSTGVWRIDTVEYDTAGLITVSCRDVGSILVDQIIFPPIVPKNFYPVTFTATQTEPGFIGPSANTVTQDTASVTRAPGWNGPVTGPASCTATAGSDAVSVSWTRPTTADTSGTNTTYGYKVVGYQIAIDNVILNRQYGAGTLSATLGATDGIHNGNAYSIRVIAVWKEQLTRAGELHFKTNVLNETRSNFSPESIVRPASVGAVATVTPGSIVIDLNEANELQPGYVTWAYTGPGTYTCIAYNGDDNSTRFVYKVDVTDASGKTHVDTGSDLGDMRAWNYLVYGADANGAIGPGDVYFASTGPGGWFGAPATGATPKDAPKSTAPTVKTSTKTVPLKSVDVKLRYSDSSNTPYIGKGAGISEYGHTAAMAFDDSSTTYWLSIGNENNSAGFAYEWIEGECGSVTLTQVHFKAKKNHYGVYLSVYSNGKWVQHSDTGVIPYNPNLPESHNHANIPYAEYHSMGDDDTYTFTLRKPVPEVTKIRLTFHNLQYFDVGTYKYRAGCCNFTAKGQSGGGKTSTTTTTVPATVTGGISGAGTGTEKSVTTYIPAHINPGLGANPGLYDDYTDIVKLLCAWAGFYWPAGAYTVNSDGSQVPWSWGIGPYGLPNVDPVLGDVDSGRVWGDFEQTGTAGIASLPPSLFAHKTLMDGISYVRDIVQFNFFIDEDGAVVWRRPNIYSIGNWVGNDASSNVPVRVTNCITIDEEQTLVGLRAKLDGKNVRERVFISSVDGAIGALAAGYNPNPTGLRRVGGWTDMHFSSTEECRVMADLIAVQQLMSYRTDSVTIPAYPAIQVDDQVLIVEQVTGEGYYHYVKGINSSNDLDAGGWEYVLDTQWLGERPFDAWVFNPAGLSQETQTYLDAINFGVVTALPHGSV